MHCPCPSPSPSISHRTVFTVLAKTASPFTFVVTSAFHILLPGLLLFKSGNFLLITRILEMGVIRHTGQLLAFRAKDVSQKLLLLQKPSHCMQFSAFIYENLIDLTALYFTNILNVAFFASRKEQLTDL